MIVPQMRQGAFTGYSSEGTGSLLNAVMNARRASVMERQQAVNEEINARNRADYERRVAAGKQMGAYLRADEKAKTEQEKIIRDRNLASSYSAPNKLYNVAQFFNDYLNPFAPSRSARAAQESQSVERTRRNPRPNKSDYLGDEYYESLQLLSPQQLQTFFPTNQSLLMNVNTNQNNPYNFR